MSARRIDPLEPRRRVAKLQAGHQSPLLQQLKDAIHTRASHMPFTGTQAILDLHRARRHDWSARRSMIASRAAPL